MTTWIVGPVAWDTVIYTDEFLVRGGSTQGKRFIERSGGTGANVARALCTSGVVTGFVGYLGNDSYAEILERELTESGIDKLSLLRIDGPTSHVLILVDNSGDRSILGMAPDSLELVNLKNVPLAKNDIVVFVLWRQHFGDDLELAKSKGCRIVVGLDAINDERVTGIELAIGSHNDVSAEFEPSALLDRFDRIVVTKGAEGATEHSQTGITHVPALTANVVDATGAGDAFLAGYLTALDKNLPEAEARLTLGAKWAAKTIETESSVPPSFETL